MRIKILLVEDTKIAQLFGTLLLEKLNTLVDVASTGCQALQYIDKHHYDVILMDLGLPGIDGLTVTQKIKQLPDRSKSATPIIALTAHSDEGTKARCLRAGMVDFITKPLTPEKAQRIIAQVTSANHHTHDRKTQEANHAEKP